MIVKRNDLNISVCSYVIVDKFLGESLSTSLRNEVAALARKGYMSNNQVQFGSKRYTKPNIFEVDMHDEKFDKKSCPHFSKIFENRAIVKSLKEQLPELVLRDDYNAVTIKLQWNRGHGGCFPLHFDNVGRPNKRSLTCAVYLNPDWRKGDGGELQLFPFLEKPLNVQPLMDRLVIFRSDLLLHRVLPAFKERFCFTIWIDSDVTNCNDDVFLKSKHLSVSANPFLKTSPLQRVLSRVIYHNEYKQSIVDCMGKDTEASKAMLASHLAHVLSLLKNKQVAAFVAVLKKKMKDASSFSSNDTVQEMSRDDHESDGDESDEVVLD